MQAEGSFLGEDSSPWAKQPSLGQLSKDMISISDQKVSRREAHVSRESSTSVNKQLKSVEDKSSSGRGKISPDGQTIDAATDSKDLSVNEDDDQSDPGPDNFLVVKPKPAQRKSHFSSPEANQKPLALLTPTTSQRLKTPLIQPFVVKRPKDESPKRSMEKPQQSLKDVNNVHHPSFNFDRFKNFMFSRPIRNRSSFLTFLEEIKTDVELISSIEKKEPCPPKVALQNLDKSKP